MRLSEIKAGVVGVGFIGVAHVEALRRLGVDVIGVVGSTPERASAKAEAANLPEVYDSVEALAEAADVVHIASPNHAHADQVRSVLEAGSHVVCEKPLALTSGDTADLVARADEAGLVNAVCFNIRFYPSCHQARAMVAAGELGEPRLVTGSYLQDWLLRDTDWNWRLEPDKAGGLRAVADIGSHWLDLARFVTGSDVVEVMADLHTLVPVRRHPAGPVETFAAVDEDAELVEEEMSSDDAAGIMLRFANGARGVVAISQVSAGRKNSVSIEVDGSDSAVSWFSETPDHLWVGHRGRPNEILQRDPGLAAPEAARIIGYPGGHVEGYPDTFRALFGEVYADVARGGPAAQPTYPTFADGHDALLVTEAVAQSSAEQRWVSVTR
ncbi:MAG: Gfo/Idh/MocA family oxidoreductase [Acidimicrobiia bacterium]|nr:Gfo/Idh/MocA family oxidoreductase [Acidimicrobiia bacterium]NNF10929.1 Gfo/Idh/MocA family oxidoreductase [Acidimicrobiia bacterium]NNL69393.1 Gfo/Idh/MocA family oxidoreductase [Acidimicrobiia bacterium]